MLGRILIIMRIAGILLLVGVITFFIIYKLLFGIWIIALIVATGTVIFFAIMSLFFTKSREIKIKYEEKLALVEALSREGRYQDARRLLDGDYKSPIILDSTATPILSEDEQARFCPQCGSKALEKFRNLLKFTHEQQYHCSDCNWRGVESQCLNASQLRKEEKRTKFLTRHIRENRNSKRKLQALARSYSLQQIKLKKNSLSSQSGIGHPPERGFNRDEEATQL